MGVFSITYQVRVTEITSGISSEPNKTQPPPLVTFFLLTLFAKHIAGSDIRSCMMPYSVIGRERVNRIVANF